MSQDIGGRRERYELGIRSQELAVRIGSKQFSSLPFFEKVRPTEGRTDGNLTKIKRVSAQDIRYTTYVVSISMKISKLEFPKRKNCTIPAGESKN